MILWLLNLIIKIINKVLQIGKLLTRFSNTNINSARIGGTRQRRNVNGYTKKLVAANQSWRCAHCHNSLPASYEVDHIIPLFGGGSNHRSNLQALCRNCHGEKTFRNLR